MNGDRDLPLRGEIWTAETGLPRRHHWVLVVSADERNLSKNIDTVLAAPFGSVGREGPTTVRLEGSETGLPGTSFLKAHFISTEKKTQLKSRVRRLSDERMRQVVLLVRRAFDPDAPSGRAVESETREL